jgi:VWFA-related protein
MAQVTPKPGEQDEVVSVKTRLVNIDVMVKDKRGKYISDLKLEDFVVYEDGVAQKLEFFDPPLVGDVPLPAPPAAKGSPRNFISLVLDFQTTEHTNLKQVREGTLKYIRERISNDDTVALFSVSNSLQLLQPFTQNRATLLAAVEKAYSSSPGSKTSEQRRISEDIERLREKASGSAGAVEAAQGGAAGAGASAAEAMIASRVLQQFLKLRSSLSLQQSRPVLAALAAISEALRSIPGKKTLVLFSQGFVTPETLDWQVQSTVDIANRANVAIYIIDSAGLIANVQRQGKHVPNTPLAGVSAITNQEQRIRAVGGETIFDNVRHEGVNREYDILYRISNDTGGRFFKGNNDIAAGLERIDDEIRARYTLAFHSTNQNFDGGFRKLRVDVSRPNAQVIARSGYYAIAHDEIVPLSPADKKLLAGIASALTAPTLPLFLELSSFRSRGGRYIVPLSFEVPPSAIKFDQKADKQLMQLEVLGVVRETDEKVLSRLGGSFDVSLSAEQYQSILSNNIFYRQDIELAPGTYGIDLIVRDRLSGKIAAKREKLILPDSPPAFSMSGVVLSRHAEAAPRGASAYEDVFNYAGARIRPSPTREFRASDKLIIFFELYGAVMDTQSGKSNVKVTVALMKDNRAATKPIEHTLTDTLVDPVPHLTFAKFVSLTGLVEGKYTAMINVKDMANSKTFSQQASFSVVK